MHAKESHYLAGLERENVATEIQWKVAGRVPFKRPTEHCAPTWSWASTIGTMMMPRHGSAYLFEIVEAETFPLGDPYRQVSGGHLRIRGLLCQIKVIERSDGNIATGDDVGLQDESIMIKGRIFGLKHDEDGIFWDNDCRRTLLSFNGFSFNLLVGQLKTNGSDIDVVRGLLLQQTRARRGQYQRVAYLDLKGEDLINNITSASLAGTLPEDAYEDFEGDDQYTIEIVWPLV
jgi:hypothetical protein